MLSFLGLIVLLSSCSIVHMPYKRDKIIRKYTASHEIYLDDSKIDFIDYYLDTGNIKSITRNKNDKTIYIERDSIIPFLTFEEYFKDKGADKLVILNGVPIETENGRKLKISPNALIEVTVLKNDTLNSIFSCRTKDVVIIFKVK